MTTLLISNPPRRNRKGQFVKGGKRRATTRKRRRRAATTTTSRRRRTRTASSAPRRRRRSSSAGGTGKLTLRKALPQAAAGLAGYAATDFGTDWVVARLPATVTSRIPPIAAPAVKGAVAVALGEVVRRAAPRQMRKFGHMVTIGGLISAGIDAIAIFRAGRGLSGYWSPEQTMEGYWSPGQQTPELGYGDDITDDYAQRMDRLGLGAGTVVMDTDAF